MTAETSGGETSASVVNARVKLVYHLGAGAQLKPELVVDGATLECRDIEVSYGSAGMGLVHVIADLGTVQVEYVNDEEWPTTTPALP